MTLGDTTTRPAGWTAATVLGCGLLLVAAVFALFSLHREIDFDEAYYLNIAKSIRRTGFPLVTSTWDLGSRELFVTSPPLVVAVASITEGAWPGRTFPARLVHVLVFTLPVYVLVWYIARREFGPISACFSVAAMLGSINFLGHGCFVRLDVPLALFSLLSLWCVHRAVESERGANRWSLLAALSLAAAVLTKYQAICIPVGLGLYLAWAALHRDRETLRRMIRPLAFQACAGAIAVVALYAYFNLASASSAGSHGGGLAGQLSRIASSTEVSASPTVRLAFLPLMGLVFLGWTIVPAGLGMLPARAPSHFSTLLACFCAAVVLFNLWVYRLPGAGAWYLLLMVPPIAILVGRAAAVALGWQRTPCSAAALALIAVCLVWQFHEARPWCVPFASERHSRYADVAAWIAAAGPQRCGVLADNRGIEYFSDHPTATMQYMAHPLLREYLTGQGPYPVDYVMLRTRWIEHPPSLLAEHWGEVISLLRRDFKQVPLDVPGVILLRRG